MKTLLFFALLITFSGQAQNPITTHDWQEWNTTWATLTGTAEARYDDRWTGSYLYCEAPNQFVLKSLPVVRTTPYHTISVRYCSNVSVNLTVRTTLNCGYVVAILPPTPRPVTVQFRFWAPVIVGIMFYNRIDFNRPWLELDDVVIDEP